MSDDLRDLTKKTDVVSRQAAIEIVDFECGKWRGLAKTIAKRLSDVPTAQPEQRWISCSERLPELNSRCVLLYGNDNISGGYYRGNRTFDVDYGDEDVSIMVIAWMPLPEPCEERREE